jgi:hypothetical protein
MAMMNMNYEYSSTAKDAESIRHRFRDMQIFRRWAPSLFANPFRNFPSCSNPKRLKSHYSQDLQCDFCLGLQELINSSTYLTGLDSSAGLENVNSVGRARQAKSKRFALTKGAGHSYIARP